MKSVVVTGASTGIGWGTAKILIENGFQVFGGVRKEGDAERLRTEFGASFTPLLLDVTDPQAPFAAARTVSAALGKDTLFGLVNNAGIAVPGPLLYLTPEEMRRQFDVNVTGQLTVTQAFAPLLGADPERQGTRGRVVMISSVGGRRAFPFMGPYAASKFALEGLSEALRREFMLLGIEVVVIAPGAVVTKIWDKAEAEDVTRFANTPYASALARMRETMTKMGRAGLAPEDLGRAVLHALTTPKPKVRYVVTRQKFQEFMMDVLPKRWLDRMIAKQLGFGR